MIYVHSICRCLPVYTHIGNFSKIEFIKYKLQSRTTVCYYFSTDYSDSYS